MEDWTLGSFNPQTRMRSVQLIPLSGRFSLEEKESEPLFLGRDTLIEWASGGGQAAIPVYSTIRVQLRACWWSSIVTLIRFLTWMRHDSLESKRFRSVCYDSRAKCILRTSDLLPAMRIIFSIRGFQSKCIFSVFFLIFHFQSSKRVSVFYVLQEPSFSVRYYASGYARHTLCFCMVEGTWKHSSLFTWNSPNEAFSSEINRAWKIWQGPEVNFYHASSYTYVSFSASWKMFIDFFALWWHDGQRGYLRIQRRR